MNIQRINVTALASFYPPAEDIYEAYVGLDDIASDS